MREGSPDGGEEDSGIIALSILMDIIAFLLTDARCALTEPVREALTLYLAEHELKDIFQVPIAGAAFQFLILFKHV